MQTKNMICWWEVLFDFRWVKTEYLEDLLCRLTHLNVSHDLSRKMSIKMGKGYRSAYSLAKRILFIPLKWTELCYSMESDLFVSSAVMQIFMLEETALWIVLLHYTRFWCETIPYIFQNIFKIHKSLSKL